MASDSNPSNSAFIPNTQGILQLAAEMRSAGQRALSDVWRVLRRWGQEYKRRVQRVIPVKYGLARQSMQVVEQNDGKTMSVTLGTSLKSEDGEPYPLYLEMGTELIAGGRVKDWHEGDEPIMDWPAKIDDLPNFRRDRNALGQFTRREAGRKGTAKFERSVSIATRAFTRGQGEQMPFMRPVGYEIAARIVEDCRVAVRDGFAAVMKGRRF